MPMRNRSRHLLLEREKKTRADNERGYPEAIERSVCLRPEDTKGDDLEPVGGCTGNDKPETDRDCPSWKGRDRRPEPPVPGSTHGLAAQFRAARQDESSDNILARSRRFFVGQRAVIRLKNQAQSNGDLPDPDSIDV